MYILFYIAYSSVFERLFAPAIDYGQIEMVQKVMITTVTPVSIILCECAFFFYKIRSGAASPHKVGSESFVHTHSVQQVHVTVQSAANTTIWSLQIEDGIDPVNSLLENAIDIMVSLHSPIASGT